MFPFLGQSPKTGGGNIISESEAGTAPTPTTPASTNNKDYADESACTIINGKQVCTGFSVTCGGHRAPSCHRCPDKAPTRNARYLWIKVEGIIQIVIKLDCVKRDRAQKALNFIPSH